MRIHIHIVDDNENWLNWGNLVQAWIRNTKTRPGNVGDLKRQLADNQVKSGCRRSDTKPVEFWHPSQPDTVASNVPTSDGTITVFQGQDAEKHMTLLRLVSTPAPSPPKNAKGEVPGPTVVLFLSYVLDVRNPDVYRLKKGQF